MHEFHGEECGKRLSGMIQFPTLSAPVDEDMDFAPFLEMQAYWKKTYPLLHEKLSFRQVGKAGCLYRWKGTGKGNLPPLMLMAHQDVVPAGDPGAWKYPPFSGTIDQGAVWGRGTADCKGQICAQMEAVEALLEEGYQPDYDLYLFYGYNEEVMSSPEVSAAAIAARELEAEGIRFGGILDEGGGVLDGSRWGVPGGLCTIIMAEKGYGDFEITATCPGGHSSKPYPNGALTKIAKAILAIEENPFPYRLTETIRNRFQTLAPYIAKDNPELGRLLEDMEGNWEALQPWIASDPEVSAMFHTTMAPTMASGSEQANILPATARVVVNCRLLEGDTLESVEAHIRSLLEPGMEVRLLRGSNPSAQSVYEGKLKDLIVQICRERYGEIVDIPDLMLGGTDAKHMYGLSDRVYRFSPFYKDEGISGAHAANESIALKTLAGGCAVYYELLKGYRGV